MRKARLGGVLHGMHRRGPGSVCFGGYFRAFRALGAVVIVVARKIGLPDVVNVGLAALCVGGEQESHRLASHCIENVWLERRYVMPLVKIHVVKGRYDQARIAKVSSAIQSALI